MKQRADSDAISCDAVILAGGVDKYAKFTKTLPNKNFIKIKKRPLFIHVLLTLLKIGRINRISIIGPKREIEKELFQLPRNDVPMEKVIPFQESKNNTVQNIMAAFKNSLDGYHNGLEDYNPAIRQKALLVVCGDAPLITPLEVNQFLDGCDTSKYDYFFGMTPASSLEYYEPKKGGAGIRMEHTPFAGEFMRLNNLHLVKPFRIQNLQEFQEIYNVRHLRNFANVVRLFCGLAKRNFKISDWIASFKMILATFAARKKLPAVTNYLIRNITMERVEKAAGGLLGARAKIVTTTYGGSALDIDRKEDVHTIEKHYDDWINHQQSLADRPL